VTVIAARAIRSMAVSGSGQIELQDVRQEHGIRHAMSYVKFAAQRISERVDRRGGTARPEHQRANLMQRDASCDLLHPVTTRSAMSGNEGCQPLLRLT